MKKLIYKVKVRSRNWRQIAAVEKDNIIEGNGQKQYWVVLTAGNGQVIFQTEMYEPKRWAKRIAELMARQLGLDSYEIDGVIVKISDLKSQIET